MSDDKHLKQAVLDELKWEPSVNAAHIGVTTKDGVVTLMGSVETYAEKHAAETATLRVKDVKAVAEEIEVKLPFSVKHGDSEIASAAVDRLAWNVSVPKDAIKVTVSKGWVTLTGDVHCTISTMPPPMRCARCGALLACRTRSRSSLRQMPATSSPTSWSRCTGPGSRRTTSVSLRMTARSL